MSTTASATYLNAIATDVSTLAGWAAIYSTIPSGGSQGTELVGHVAISWGSVSGGVVVGTATFTGLTSGMDIKGCGLHSSATANTGFLSGGSVTEVDLTVSGSYTVTITQTIANV